VILLKSLVGGQCLCPVCGRASEVDREPPPPPPMVAVVLPRGMRRIPPVVRPPQRYVIHCEGCGRLVRDGTCWVEAI
jgi:hypothetical protein